MNKTEFYKNAIEHILKHDIDNMKYYFGSKNYECPIYDNIIDSLDIVMEDFNNFFKKINIDYEISKSDTIDLVKESIKQNFEGETIICIPFKHIYEHLLENEIVKADNEIRVYRIENKNYEGFFTHFSDQNKPLNEKYDFDMDAAPNQDGILTLEFSNLEYRKIGQSNIFGFPSQEAISYFLENQIPINESDKLFYDIANEELFVSEYMVKESHCLITKNQVVFDEKNCRLTKRTPVSKFFDGRLEQQAYEKRLQNEPEKLKDSDEILSFLKEKSGDVTVTKKKRRKNKKDNFRNNGDQLNLF